MLIIKYYRQTHCIKDHDVDDDFNARCHEFQFKCDHVFT